MSDTQTYVKRYTNPVYEHDCKSCIYLGTVTFTEPKNVFPVPRNFAGTYDLYCCKGQCETTIIARFSSDGPAYYSGLVFGRTGSMVPLAAAYTLACVNGLIDSDTKDWS